MSNPPDPDEIPKYVSIGISRNYEFTMTKSTYDTTYIVITIIGIIAFIMIMFLLYYSISKIGEWQPEERTISLGTQSYNNNTNYGATYTGKYFRNKEEPIPGSGILTESQCPGAFNNNTCTCPDNFIGKYCNRELFHAGYLGVGNIDGGIVKYLGKYIVDGLSFSDGVNCTDICDRDIGCTGVRYSGDVCMTIGVKVYVDKDEISYDVDTMPNLYLKGGNEELVIMNGIYLSTYKMTMPVRYWASEDSVYFMSVKIGEVNEVKFFPRYCVGGDGGYTGLYSIERFYKDDVDELLEYGEVGQIYVCESGEELKLPEDWEDKLPVYCYYF